MYITKSFRINILRILDTTCKNVSVSLKELLHSYRNGNLLLCKEMWHTFIATCVVFFKREGVQYYKFDFKVLDITDYYI